MRKKLFTVLSIILVLSIMVSGVVYACSKISICHATGSESNPYVEITVDDDGWFNGHINHLKDIIPMPAGGCPRPDPTETPAPTDTLEPTATDTLEPTVTETLRPTVTSTGTLELTSTHTATPIIIMESVTPTPRPTVINTLVSVVPNASSCCVCCPIDRTREIKSIHTVVDRFTADSTTRIEIDECCYAKVYVDGKLTFHINLAGWIIEYK